MKLLELVVLASGLTRLAAAMALPESDATKKVVAMDLTRRYPANTVGHNRRRWQRRDGSLDVTLNNKETLYFANISLGTPAQSLELHIDTGSSDLWVNLANSSFCSKKNACAGGTFNSKSTSSLKFVNSAFNISYVDGTGASGDYVSDTLVFGGATLSNFQFGLGTQSTSTEGVLGIGYMSNEVQVQGAELGAYPNLPQALKNSGQIHRNAYSLWLNDQESSTGTILFGGVNRDKYQGELTTLPVLQVDGEYTDLVVGLSNVSMNGNMITTSSLPVGALLDSGSTLTYLPADIASVVYEKLGATYDQEAGYGIVSCTLADKNGTIEYSFSGATISVAYEELVIDLGDTGRTRSCMFGIAPTDGDMLIFGDTFLRSAYVVYDLENNQISIAQTVFNATTNDIEEIPAGTSLPPGASMAPNAISSVAGTSSGLSASTSGTKKSDAVSRYYPTSKLMWGISGGLVVTFTLLG